jgi:glycosyltransferase involved in cell wall biosynthesis
MDIKKINSAIITPEFPPMTNWGGLATFNLQLAYILSKLCNKVHIVTYDGTGLNEKQLTQGNLTIHYIKLRTNSKLLNFLYYKFPVGIFRNPLKRIFPDLIFILDWNIFSLLYFIKLQKTARIRVIHSSTYYSPAILIKTLFPKIKLISHLQGHLEVLNKFDKKTTESNILEKLEVLYINHFSDKAIACSKSIMDLYLKVHLSAENKLLYIPNFLIIPKKQPPSTKINKYNLVFYGRIEYRKGTDILVRAFLKLAKLYPHLKLFLIGEERHNFLINKNRVSFEKLVEHLNIPADIFKRIIFIPKISENNSMLNILSLINGIVVVPSRYEPFGFAIIEPMSLGLPVVASSLGGGSEIIKNGVDGFLSEPNVKSLTMVLLKVIETPDESLLKIVKMSQRKIHKNYSSKTAKTAYKKLYKSTLMENE